MFPSPRALLLLACLSLMAPLLLPLASAQAQNAGPPGGGPGGGKPNPPARPDPSPPEPSKPAPPRPNPTRPNPRPNPPRPNPPRPNPARPGGDRPAPRPPVRPRPPVVVHPPVIVRPPIVARPPIGPGGQGRPRYHLDAYRRPPGYFQQRWVVGALLPSLFRAAPYELVYGSYGLRAPPPDAQWVRVDNDALLIDQRTGRVIEVVYDIFY